VFSSVFLPVASLVLLWALLVGAMGSPNSTAEPAYVDFCRGGCIKNMGVPQCPTGVLFTRQTGECVSGQFKDSTGNAFSSLMVRPIANSSNYALDFYGGGECLNLLQTNGPYIRASCCPTSFSLGWAVVGGFVVRNVTASPRGENAPIRLN
jgi:hypothetical protein